MLGAQPRLPSPRVSPCRAWGLARGYGGRGGAGRYRGVGTASAILLCCRLQPPSPSPGLWSVASPPGSSEGGVQGVVFLERLEYCEVLLALCALSFFFIVRFFPCLLLQADISMRVKYFCSWAATQNNPPIPFHNSLPKFLLLVPVA